MQHDKEKAILEITQDMVRQGGYNGFSFRNIANAVGIKSSSVHYHFATKEDLAVAVTEQYTEHFMASLGDPNELVGRGENPVLNYISAFRQALSEDKGMCLCGMLGAETDILPESVANKTRDFFDRNIHWLESAYQAIELDDSVNARALQTLSLLEGAMILCTVSRDMNRFDTATQLLRESLL